MGQLMGSGSSKAKEAFTITPAASSIPGPADADTPLPKVSIVDIANSVEDPETVQSWLANAPIAPTEPDYHSQEPAATDTDAEAIEVDLEDEDGLSAVGVDADVVLEDAGDSAPDLGVELARDEVLTPIPEHLGVGDVVGHGIAVAGDDFEQGNVTLIAYAAEGNGPEHEVLYGWVDKTAEQKLFAALNSDGTNLVPVEVISHVTGRLPADIDNGLYEKLGVVAKSVNHHLKAGSEIPAHTHTNLEELIAKLDEVAAANPTSDEQEMLDHYFGAVEQLSERLTPGYDIPYSEGGKTPHFASHVVDHEVKTTKMVPGPPDPDQPTLLPMTKRNATRIGSTLKDGVGSWDGVTRTTASGSEYVIDLGEGFEAIYRPHDPTLGGHSAGKGHQGFLEVTAPAGAGHGAELVHRLEQLHLVNQPITKAEGEYTYLQRQAWALKADKKPGIVNATANAAELDDTMAEIVFNERVGDAPDDPAEIDRWIRSVQLEGQRRAQPAKAALMREAIAPLLGHTDGASLAADPAYDPTPTPSGGWLTWHRMDVTRDPAAVRKAFGKKALVHQVTGNNLAEIFQTGVLAATERRRVMGIGAGKGMSESADMNTGGSRVVDLRVKNPTGLSGPHLIWDDPVKLLKRADWYAYNGDKFAALDGAAQIRDPFKTASMTASSNEVLFHNGIDLTGPEAPDRIVCSSTHQKKELLAVLKTRGITHLGDKPVGEVIQ